MARKLNLITPRPAAPEPAPGPGSAPPPVRLLEPGETLISAAALEAKLGIDQATLYRAAARQELPCFRLGRCVRFLEREVLAWMRREAGPSEASSTP